MAILDIEERLNQARIRQVPVGKMTVPRKWRQEIVCTDRCDDCIMAQYGCAKKCIRFPDAVCDTCPCRASVGAGKINPYKGEDNGR